MYRNFFKRKWMSFDVLDYIVSIPLMFKVGYTVRGDSTFHLIRNEDGVLYADDFNERNVEELVIQYQEDGLTMNYLVYEPLDKSHIPYIKERFNRLIKNHPSTKIKVKSKDLYSMQMKLRQEIEKVTNIKTPYDGKDLIINLNGSEQCVRDRLCPLLQRLGNCCVPVTVLIHLAGTPVEEIDSTMDEIAMYELDQQEKASESVDGI